MHQTPPPLPRLLLIEDDLISRSFLQTALEALPAQVDCAETLKGALDCAGQHDYALWLIDVNLPDGRGSDLLEQLRRDHPLTPALAHTADTCDALARQLRDDGFENVLVKPLSRESLLRSVRAALPPVATDLQALPAWDEARALSALNGQQAHIKALRDLFMGELPSVRDAIAQALRDEERGQLQQQLHRLQASCGFVGAARLGAAAAQLQQQPENPAARASLTQAIQQLLLN